MRPFPPDVETLVSALARTPSVAEIIFGRDDENLRILGELEARPQPGLVPHLLPFIFGSSRAVARGAARVLAASVAAATPQDLLEIDERCRKVWSAWLPASEGGWRALRPAEVSRFIRFGDDEIAVVGIASFHASGWVREAAVTRLDMFGTGEELPFLLLRLNDWVRPVAERAEQAVRRRLVPQLAGAFVRNLPIVRRLGISRRRDHRALVESVVELLKTTASRTVVERGLDTTDVTARRVLFRVARARADFDKAAVLRHALRDADTVVRVEAVSDARATMSFEALREMLPEIITDSYPRVRREGVAIAAQSPGDDGRQMLVDALLDRNQVVREVARFCLLRRGELRDFASFYREQIADSSTLDASAGRLAVAVAGLGETGAMEDTVMLASLLDRPQPAVRRASIRAIVALGVGDQLRRLVRMLLDPSPGVSHVARRVLRPRASVVGLEALRNLLRDAPYAHSRFDAVSVGAALGKWESLPLMLEAAADVDGAIRDVGRRRLGLWVANQNRSFVRPTQEQLRTLGSALEEFGSAVDRRIIEELRANHYYWTSSALRDPAP